MIRYGAKSPALWRVELPIPKLYGNGWMIAGRLGGIFEFGAIEGHSPGD